MKKRSFRSTFVSVILVITVAISIVNLAVYGINIKKIRQVEVLKMKTAGERIDDMITISLNNIKGLKQICCTDNYARNILLKNNEKNDIGTKFENQNYMDNALKHIASMDTLILRAIIVNKYGNIYCTDTSIPEEYVKTIRNMTKEWMLFEGKEDEYYYKPKVRSVVSMGIGAVKTDFSEAVPEDAVYFDGSTGIQGHNKLTFLYAKTIYDIMAEVKIPLGELPMLWGRRDVNEKSNSPAMLGRME